MEITTKENCLSELLNLDKYYSFANGVNIKDHEIKEWIEKSFIKSLEECKKEKLKRYSTTTSTGNAKLFIEFYRQENGLYTIHANLTRNYSTQSFCNVE